MKSAEAFDRRVFGRRQTDIRASVRIGYQVVACTIKDLSDGGALLEFEQQIDLPARVRLSWPDQPTEVVCEVRHVRRNRAGVQFTRPQAFNLKPAVTPPGVFKPASSGATDERLGASANSLVAEHRRGLRQAPADPSPSLARAPAPAVAGTAVSKVSPASEPPRDLSALKASLQAAALAIVEQREARRVPMPLAPSRSAGAPVQPPPVAAAACVPRPFVMTRGLSVAPPAPECVKTGPVPGPLAASAYGAATEAADLQLRGCEGHACAFGVWRRLANLPPRPLPARAYRMPPETKVA